LQPKVQVVNISMIAILTDPEVGGTFLNWTVHYLSGDATYYHASSDQHVAIPHDPVNKNNAHGFNPNNPNSLNAFQFVFERLCGQSTPTTIYFHNFSRSPIVQTRTAIQSLIPVVQHLVTVTLSQPMKMYNCVHKHRSNVLTAWGDTKHFAHDHHYEVLSDYFFADSKKIWDQQQLNQIWDRREFMALNHDPRHGYSIDQVLDPAVPHYKIDAVDLWTVFDDSVFALFDYLGRQVDQQRYQAWLPIYSTWKRIHYQRMMFAWYFDIIVNNVLQGVDFDLKRFNLDIRQEAAVQHALIYDHNLNLKTWQLEKFLNCRQLHDLLEPNIHDLSQSRLHYSELDTAA
jgi:hypothetical protein